MTQGKRLEIKSNTDLLKMERDQVDCGRTYSQKDTIELSGWGIIKGREHILRK